MLEQQTRTAQSFEEEKAEGRLLLLIDDIEAATKQFASLKEESETLSTKLKDLEFHLDELHLERDSLSSAPEPLSSSQPVVPSTSDDVSQTADGKFFPYYNSLENREIENKGRLEGHQQLAAELNHQLNKLGQTNKKLKIEYEQISANFAKEESVYKESLNFLQDLELKYDTKSKENEFLLQQCDTLRSELDERNGDLMEVAVEEAERLRAELKEKQEKLTRKRKKAANLRIEYARLEKRNQEELVKQKGKSEKEATVNQWRNERVILKNKLTKIRTQLLSEQRNIENSAKRDQELELKYTQILGSEHNFGDCEMGRKCVLASIADESEMKVNRVNVEEIDHEDDYEEQLKKELAVVEKSRSVFDAYRESQIRALNDELAGCAQLGYINLLKEELADLQAQLMKLQ